MKDPWKNRLVKASRELHKGGAPVWWDGFYNVLAWGESSCDDDNPYDPNLGEKNEYAEYKAGARAAESLQHHMKKNLDYI